MSNLPPELAALPPPSILEDLDYEARRAALIDRFVQAANSAGIPYDVDRLESEPGVYLLEVSAYQDILLRQRINEAIKSWFLTYATGGDLDVLAQWYDVERLYGEDDDALRRRVVLAIQGRSPGGTEARYKSIALGADPRVADAAVYTVGRDPTVRVAIFAKDNDGVPTPDLLEAVDAALQAPNVRMVNDTIVVSPASRYAINIEADVWLLPGSPQSLVDDMETSLREAWRRDMGLGRDLTRSWLTARLHVDGVQRVEIVEPAEDVDIPFNEAGALGAVTLTVKGRSY